jgi:SAM-dependent methyltransferase
MMYSRKFHKKRIGNPRYPRLAAATLTTLETIDYEYNLICDVGCSVGALLQAIKDETPSKTKFAGVEYDVVKKEMIIKPCTFVKHDLNKGGLKLPKGRKADLVICQEVLEHVEPENTEKALKSISDIAADKATLVFGAGHPGQPGTHHVNCKPHSSWRKLLEEYGWVIDRKATRRYKKRLKSEGHPETSCYYINTMCFRRSL